MKRKIITIDEGKCTGCGICIPNCPEGAIQIIDEKARLVSDLFCDGLGACLGHCPEGAINIEEREAEPYDERTVMKNIIKQGPNVIKAHLRHLRDHNEQEYLAAALDELKAQGIETDEKTPAAPAPVHHGSGCPGSRSFQFEGTPEPAPLTTDTGEAHPSELRHWPVQMHLISPSAGHYRSADVILAADCVAFSMGDFHRTFLKGKTLAIACPKLDQGKEIYQEKLRSLIDDARINTLTVIIMEVPCCGGLLHLAKQAAAEAVRKVPIKAVTVSIDGKVLQEDWV
ncbi:MAG: 4Fe-4S binding protein [Chitinispirillaceae bacterium]|nr:4Fe-4S binding protein [Chitinispirillaceae bacterium]